MKRPVRDWIRGLAVAAGAVGYAVLAHISNSHPEASALGVVLAIGPLAAFAVAIVWRSGHRLWSVALGLLAVLAVYRTWPILALHFSWLYLLQQAGFYGLIGIAFGRSLAAGQVPLCTRWATAVHGPLASPVVRYTRSVTAAWTLFFALMTTTLVALFLLAPLPVWSAFANFGTFPLVVAMFLAEYRVRGRVLPDMRHASILESVRASVSRAPAPGALRRG